MKKKNKTTGNVLIITDNVHCLKIAREIQSTFVGVFIFQSVAGKIAGLPAMDVSKQYSHIIKKYDLIISLHCQQIFPRQLVENKRCINVHPGLTPYNRGWYPHVFSIINGLPAGVTIHAMDHEIDHGPIIYQKAYKIKLHDTSESVYLNLLKLERNLLMEKFSVLRSGAYRQKAIKQEGNVNLKSDFEKLKKIDLNQNGTFREFINTLRALSHGEFLNAYVNDSQGKKIYMRLILRPEK